MDDKSAVMPHVTTNSDTSLVSVAICTRNRKWSVLSAVRSVLAGTYENVEVLVVDQSDDKSTEDAVKSIADDRVHYFHADVPGKPGALNFALNQANGQILALTDDDCEADAHWIETSVRAMAATPGVCCVFGQVTPAAHDSATTYVDGCWFDQSERVCDQHSFYDFKHHKHIGIGANMVLLRSAVQSIGGWDPCIGPGARFGSGDDYDCALRLLLAGGTVAFEPTSVVTHYGFRRAEIRMTDDMRCAYGSGAVFAKHIRCGVVAYGPSTAIRECIAISFGRFLRLRLPLCLAGARAWMRGFVDGCAHPVDRANRCYLPVSELESRKFADFYAKVELRVDPRL